MPRDFAARKDSNHRLIVEYLQLHGYAELSAARAAVRDAALVAAWDAARDAQAAHLIEMLEANDATTNVD